MVVEEVVVHDDPDDDDVVAEMKREESPVYALLLEVEEVVEKVAVDLEQLDPT